MTGVATGVVCISLSAGRPTHRRAHNRRKSIAARRRLRASLGPVARLGRHSRLWYRDFFSRWLASDLVPFVNSCARFIQVLSKKGNVNIERKEWEIAFPISTAAGVLIARSIAPCRPALQRVGHLRAVWPVLATTTTAAKKWCSSTATILR